MSWHVVIRGLLWQYLDSENIDESRDFPNCCELFCDTVETSYAFVAIKQNEEQSTIMVPSSEILFMQKLP